MRFTFLVKASKPNFIKKALELVQFAVHQFQTQTNTSFDLYTQPFPTKTVKYTLLRSPHVNKKAREQIESRTYKASLVIPDVPNTQFMLAFVKLAKLLKLHGVQSKCSFETKSSL